MSSLENKVKKLESINSDLLEALQEMVANTPSLFAETNFATYSAKERAKRAIYKALRQSQIAADKHYADELERQVAEALDEAGITYLHESEGGTNGLDFYLPKKGVYIEVKKFYSERVLNQMKQADNVIVLQGKEAVNFFTQFITT